MNGHLAKQAFLCLSCCVLDSKNVDNGHSMQACEASSFIHAIDISTFDICCFIPLLVSLSLGHCCKIDIMQNLCGLFLKQFLSDYDKICSCLEKKSKKHCKTTFDSIFCVQGR